MPLYDVNHAIPLTAEQYDKIAEIITTAHSTRFGVPKFLVSVIFHDTSKSVEYVGGKRDNFNRIVGNIRPNVPGSGVQRTDESLEELAREIRAGWDKVVGDHGQEELNGIFILTALQLAMERGIVIPKAGQDSQWLKNNLKFFKDKATQGDKRYQELLEDLQNGH